MPTPVFALSLASIALIGPLAIHAFMPAIPAVKAEFAISDAAVQLAFSAGVVTMAISTLVYGSLSDRYGRRPVLLTGLALFLVGSALSAMAGSLTALILGRLVQAAGAGCGTTLVRTIARDAYGQEHLVKAIAYLTMFYTLGPMLAPLAGGVLVDVLGWRAVFVFGFVVGGGILLSSWLVIHETHTPRTARLDAVGILRSYVDPFRNLRFTAFLLQTGFSTGTFFALSTASAVIMKEMLHRPAAEFGLYFLLYPLGFLVGTYLSSRMSGRYGNERMVLAGAGVLWLSTAALAAALLAGWVTPPTLFLSGFAITVAQGLALPSSQAGAIEMVPRQPGTAAGLGVFVQWMVGAVVAQIYGLLADGTVGPLVVVTMVSSTLSFIAGATPYWMRRMARH